MNLTAIRPGETVFLDANIIIYAALSKSLQCQQLLRRCVEGEVAGITATSQLAETMHRIMMFEAQSRNHAGAGNPFRQLSEHPDRIRELSKHADVVKAILGSGLRIEPVVQEDFTVAVLLQKLHGVLTNDALMIAVMERVRVGSLATADKVFRRLSQFRIYQPDDIA